MVSTWCNIAKHLHLTLEILPVRHLKSDELIPDELVRLKIHDFVLVPSYVVNISVPRSYK